MRFIHTADWHLGNRMHDTDRHGEFEAFLLWLKDRILEEKAEALVVAGDIFDNTNPPVESRTQYIRFLASLLGTCCRNVIIVGGNHDSGILLDSEKTILQALNIHVVGTVANRTPEDMVFELIGEKGDAIGICCAVPFAREVELRDYFDEESEDGSFSDKAYGALYEKVLEAAKKLDAGRNLPVIATGHLYAADLEGRFENIKGEAESDDGRRKLDVVGKLGSVHAGIFPQELDYVALGHIHYTTMVGKNPKVRYSGSPFVLGFDEWHLPRYVLSVQVEKGKVCAVEKIEVPKTILYRRISGDCKTIRQELEKYDQVQKMPVYVELYYKREDGVNIHEELEDLICQLEEKKVFVISRKVQDSEIMLGAGGASFDSQEIKNLKPEEIFRALILSKAPDADLDKYLPLFMETFGEVENEDN